MNEALNMLFSFQVLTWIILLVSSFPLLKLPKYSKLV